PEVTQKCLQTDLAVMCVDAYSSLSRGKESLNERSTDAFPWLMDAASQFENLGELDNSINAISIGVDFALKNNLVDKAYSFFSYGRTIYETGAIEGDPSVSNPAIKKHLISLGKRILNTSQDPIETSPLSAVQAELKASILGGVSLKKAEVAEEDRDLVISHGRALYERKAIEYREGAQKYFDSGIPGNGVVFACMAALSDLMLGKTKEGMSYLVKTAANPEVKDDFQGHPCFRWTRLVFKSLVDRSKETIVTAQKMFLQIPWSYKDDKEFARRVMESIERRLNA
ncbi:MAG: hypothetical protein ACFFDR_12735, partial [Candidatus Thorarchaeota archaeon]